MFNKERFFEEFRTYYKKNAGKRAVSQSVISAVEFLLDSFENDSHWKDVRHMAYALATISHETAWTFKPIKEYRGKNLTASQKKYWPSGYYGRGYVQLTWDYNYEKATKKLGKDFLHNQDLALEPENAFNILTLGMFEGWFTGKKLEDYINSKETDYKNARRIINGLDQAAKIAGYAKELEKILSISVSAHVVDAINKIVENNDNSKSDGGSQEPIEEPVDDYPEEPKPGEPASTNGDSAKPGEPIAGGRPGDKPKEVPAVEAQTTSGWGAWVQNIRAQIASLGIGSISLGSLAFLSNPTFIYIAIGILATAILVSVTVYITAMVIKSKEKRDREQRAHELTMEQMRLAADPAKYNVVVTNQE